MRQNLIRLLTLLLGSSIALVARAESRIVVHDFYGPHAAELRDRVAALLTNQDGVTVAAKAQIEQLADELHADAFSPAGRKLISRPGQVSAWLTGVVETHKRRVRLTVIVYDGADHKWMGRAVIKGHSMVELHASLKHKLWEELRSPILASLSPLPPGRAPIERAEASRPQVASSAPAETSEEPVVEQQRAASSHAAYMEPALAPDSTRTNGGVQDDAAVESRRRRQLADPLRLALGFGSPRRSLHYSDPLSSGLNDYQLGGTLLLDASATYYPAAHFTKSWPAFFGVDLGAQGAIGATSSDSFGNRYKSHYDAYRVGVRARLPLGQHFASVFSGYAITRGSVSSESAQAVVRTPGVDYRALRSGAGAEFALAEGVAMGLDVAWLTMLSVGELGSWFPRATANGLELLLQASYAFRQHCFVRVAGSYRRAAFDFHPQPGDARVAGGETDDVLTLSAGAGVSL